MNLKKKIVAVGLAASMAAVGIVGTSLAYFTDKDVKNNNYTIGNADIVLTEPHLEEMNDLYPGEPVWKDPTVTNDGANPVFVRVKVDGMENFTYRTDYKEGKLGDNWVEYEGYYYYSKVLDTTEGNNQTDALFDQVVLNKNVTNGVSNDIKSIDVEAQAVQAQGAKTKWEDVKKMTVPEIAEWFGTAYETNA